MMLDIDRIFAAADNSSDIAQRNKSDQQGAETTARDTADASSPQGEEGVVSRPNPEEKPFEGGNSHRISTRFPLRVGTLEQAPMRVLEGFPTVPTVPTGKKTEGEVRTSTRQGGAAEEVLRAAQSRDSTRPVRHEINPAALVLCFHFLERIGASDSEIVGALRHLMWSPPAEQQRAWSVSCEGRGLQTWRLLSFPAVEEERDCMGCAYLHSAVGRVEAGERRRFRWVCAKGYPLREAARASERILTAPPECKDWTRWQPSER